MPKRSHPLDPGRRNFLKGATLAGAAALSTPVAAKTDIESVSRANAKAAVPGPRLAAAESSMAAKGSR